MHDVLMRIPFPDRGDQPLALRLLLDALPPLAVLRMLAHAPTTFEPGLAFSRALLDELALPAQVRELVILHVAQLSRCEYEWVQHADIARHCGVTDAQIDAVRRADLGAACLPSATRAALRLTCEVVRDVRPSDRALALAQESFTSRQIIELVMVAGWYMMIARVVETSGVNPEAPQGIALLDGERA